MNSYFSYFSVLCLFLISCSDYKVSNYETYQDVVNDGAIERGWIPDILPRSAYNITEAHDLDLNKGKGSFYYQDQDEETFLSKLDHSDGYQYEYFTFEIDIETNFVRFLAEL